MTVPHSKVQCKALNINYDILAKRNHKGLSVEYFHRFLNKVKTIAMEDRKSYDAFLSTGIAAGYVWNSALIDGTEILRSTVATIYFISINTEKCPISY